MSHPAPTNDTLVAGLITGAATVLRVLLLPIWFVALAVWMIVAVAAATVLKIIGPKRRPVHIGRGASLGSDRSPLSVPHQGPSYRRP